MCQKILPSEQNIVPKQKILQPRILYSAQIVFKNEDNINTFLYKMREFTECRFELEKCFLIEIYDM